MGGRDDAEFFLGAETGPGEGDAVAEVERFAGLFAHALDVSGPRGGMTAEVRLPEEGQNFLPPPTPDEERILQRTARVFLNALRLGNVEAASRIFGGDADSGRHVLREFLASIPGEILGFRVDGAFRCPGGFLVAARMDVRAPRDVFLRLGVGLHMAEVGAGGTRVLAIAPRGGGRLDPGFVRFAPTVSLRRLVETLGDLLRMGNLDAAADLFENRDRGLADLGRLVRTLPGRVLRARSAGLHPGTDGAWSVDLTFEVEQEGTPLQVAARLNARKGLRFCTFFIVDLDF